MKPRRMFLNSAAFLVAVATHAGSEPVAGLTGVMLTPGEIQTLQRKAEQKDKDAILRLGGFYLLVRNDPETASRFYSKLAAIGDADGYYCYGDSRMRVDDFETARNSLELAKQKGHPYADAALKDLERRKANAQNNPKAMPKKQ
jgi:hypothetical protein